MNQKATKQQVQWPPLLNLSKDRPNVDSSLRNFEKVNGPYLNDMLQPVYVKELHRKSTFDSKGNEYHISGTSVYKNDEAIINNITNGFNKQELDLPSNVIAYDYNGDVLYYVTYDGTDLKMFRDGVQTASSNVIANMVVIDARLRFVNDLGVLAVYFSNSSGTENLRIFDTSLTSKTLASGWWSNLLTSTGNSVEAVSTSDAVPCIHIGYRNGVYGVSLTRGAGKVIPMTNKDAAYMTIIWRAGWTNIRQLSQGFRMTSPTSTSTTVTSTESLNFILSAKESSVSTSTINVVRSGNGTVYFYNSNATKLSQLTVCTEPIPSAVITGATQYRIGTQTIDTSSTSTPSYTTFNVYQITKQSKTFTRTVKTTASLPMTYCRAVWNCNNPSTYAWEALAGSTLTIDDGNSTIEIANGSSEYGSKSVQGKVTWYSGQNPPVLTNNSTYVTYNNTAYTIPSSFINNNTGFTQTASTSSLIGQKSTNVDFNVMMDDGYFYPLFYFTPQTTKSSTVNSYWNNGLSNGYRIGWAATMAYDGNSFTIQDMVGGISLINERCPRSGSFVIDQNIFALTFKLNDTNALNPVNLNNADDVVYNGNGRFLEFYIDSTSKAFRSGPGTSRLSSFNYYSNAVFNDATLSGSSEDLLVFTAGGIHSNFNNYRLLYNVFTSGYANVSGISYKTNNNYQGTLLTPWLSVDESSYVSTSSTGILLYKDKSGKFYKITQDKSAELFTILEDRIVVVNTGSYWNAFDSEQDRVFHYASDYNGRIRFGTASNQIEFKEAIPVSGTSYSAYPYIRYTASAINPLYEVMPRHVDVSMMLPVVPRYRCYIGVEQYPACAEPSPITNSQGIDVFYSDFGSTTCTYRYTFTSVPNLRNVYAKHTLNGLIYPGSSSTTPNLSPSLFAEYINGAGNNDMIVEGYDAYTLTYYDNNPVLVYSSSTQVSNLYNKDNVFFVLQGQFYGMIGNKLYSLIYSNGAISQMDAIIDLGDLKFIGNNPMISFWFDPATRVIRSFTGDANMETLYSSTKITEYSGLHWYDETTQSIYASTNAGLLVIGPKNVYLFENWTNVTNCQFSKDGVTHITNDGETINLKYYSEDAYTVLPLDLETSFWGIGSNELTTIDRWNITLYDLDGTHPESWITVGTRSLNDVTVKSEEKTLKITPDMYDKWSNSVLISFSPKLIKGQGLRLYCKTPLIVQKIVPHIMDDRTGTATGKNRSV